MVAYFIAFIQDLHFKAYLNEAPVVSRGIYLKRDFVFKEGGILWLDYNPIGSILFSVYSNFYNEGDF